MNIDKIIISKSKHRLLFLFIISSLVFTKSINENNLFESHNQLEESILNSKKIKFKQGFTIMSTLGNGINQTTGIYSNSSRYLISDRISINTQFHLFQNKHHTTYLSKPNSGFGYDIQLEYKLSQNSHLTFQLGNYMNHPIRNMRSFINAP